MRGLTPSDLLDLAGRGRDLDWLQKGLLLASYAWPESSSADREALPVGVRDRLLLALRVWTFGRTVAVRSRCRKCGLDLEAEVDLEKILAEHTAEPPERVAIEVEEGRTSVRLPCSRDLRAVLALAPEAAQQALFEACLEAPAVAKSEAARQVVAEALAQADPLTSVDLEFQCQRCGGSSSELFDIVDCFWREIEAGARRAAAEIHTLASAYGWSEGEILALSPARRNVYLRMISQ